MKKKTVDKEKNTKIEKKQLNEEIAEEETQDEENEEEDEEAKEAEKELEQIAKSCSKEYYEENGNKEKEVSPERKARQQKIAEMANSGDVEKRRKAIEMAIFDVMNYVISVTNKMLYRMNTVFSVEDAQQQVYLHISDDIEAYNPQYSLLTWVEKKIWRSIQELTSDATGVSSYYRNKMPIINKAKQEFAEKGIYQPTPKDLHIATGLPMKTIVNVMNREQATKEVRIDDYDYDRDWTGEKADEGPSYNSSPETMVIFNQRSRDIYNALDELPWLERVVVLSRIDGVSWRDISESTGASVEELKQTHTAALKKLRQSSSLVAHKYGDKDNPSRFSKKEIAIAPMDVALDLLNDLDVMDGVDPSQFPEESPVIGIRN